MASGRVLDLIILGMALEGAVFVAVWRTSHRGVPPGDLLPNLFSGMCLLLAMRAALAGAWWGWISLPLLGALIFHINDLRRRWVTSLSPILHGEADGGGSATLPGWQGAWPRPRHHASRGPPPPQKAGENL